MANIGNRWFEKIIIQEFLAISCESEVEYSNCFLIKMQLRETMAGNCWPVATLLFDFVDILNAKAMVIKGSSALKERLVVDNPTIRKDSLDN